MASHRPLSIIVILVAFAGLVLTVFFHYAGLASVRDALNVPADWYRSDSTAMIDKYRTSMTPSYWTTYVWIVVFVFQFLWLGYGLSLICRTTDDKRAYLYVQGFVPIWMYIFFLLALVFHLAGVFSRDRDVQIASTFMYALMTLSLMATLAISYVYLYRNGGELLLGDRGFDVTVVRALIQNGASIYMTWAGFEFFVSLASNLVYENKLSSKDAGTIAISLLALVLLVYAIIDILVHDKHMCYTFTPYLTVLAGLVGILVENYAAWERNTVLVCVTITLDLVAFGFKVGFTMWRWGRCPEPIMCSDSVKRALAEREKRQLEAMKYAQQAPPPAIYPWYQPQPVYYVLPAETGYQMAPAAYSNQVLYATGDQSVGQVAYTTGDQWASQVGYSPGNQNASQVVYATGDQGAGQVVYAPGEMLALPAPESQVVTEPAAQSVIYQNAPTVIWTG